MDNLSVMEALWKSEKEEIYVRVLEDMYKECTVHTRLHEVSEKIPTKKSVR